MKKEKGKRGRGRGGATRERKKNESDYVETLERLLVGLIRVRELFPPLPLF